MAKGKKQQGSAGAARRRARKAKGVIEVRAKKEFTYRGHTLDELRALSLEEVTDILPARVRRVLNRGLTAEQHKLLERITRSEPGERTFRTHRRDMPILPVMVGHQFGVYDGKEFKAVTVQSEMIGHYLGEFAPTRKAVAHGGVGVGATRSSKFMPLK